MSMVLLWVASCAATGVPGNPARNLLVLREADSGVWHRAGLEDAVSIELASNPTTGFLWKVVRIDPAMARIDPGQSYVPDRVPPGIVGSGGKTIFPLRLLRPGKTEIVLEYRRPFENKPEPEKQVTFRLEIVPGSSR
ncbi:protease inhibitor I42 family protein [Desulfatirhabdium butyrativorans]|uniref:protease inhibitor I42 family protein n=1 Tax=Desulfatirhabdium butyrativorans TaxID=340467 RepID=UPI000424F1D1|nr:protease inhibitor I42 family protein [Desulfatirhabdium butyrativorans]